MAETHPQALAIATYLIQFGWLLLHIQGAKLVQRFGTQGQCITLFNIWLVLMHLLDIHRRYLTTFTSGLNAAATVATGAAGDNLDIFSAISTIIPSSGRELATSGLIGNSDSSAYLRQGQVKGNAALMTVQAFYTTMVCNAIPEACGLSPLSLDDAKRTSLPTVMSSRGNGGIGGAGMREMEYLVLFELVAGFCTSMALCIIWATMTFKQGGNGNGSVGVQKFSARWQRINKASHMIGVCTGDQD
ncbi:hypothetical protein BGZ46_004360 [Entomortierella lignicola]|nr:hypothetical protein BGZ46_004360 [Entomortierella lignicola]